MVQAYILIQAEVGKAASVVNAVRTIENVTDADTVTGPYDCIARVNVPDIDALGRLVVAEIQAIDGIARALTCTVVHV